MTTVSREELLALADTIDRNAETAAPLDEASCLLRHKRIISAALRLAAKPADDDVREAIEPFVYALDGVPASKSDAAPFARVPNDARTPGTVSTLTFGDLRKLVRALSPKAKP